MSQQDPLRNIWLKIGIKNTSIWVIRTGVAAISLQLRCFCALAADKCTHGDTKSERFAFFLRRYDFQYILTRPPTNHWQCFASVFNFPWMVALHARGRFTPGDSAIRLCFVYLQREEQKQTVWCERAAHSIFPTKTSSCWVTAAAITKGKHLFLMSPVSKMKHNNWCRKNYNFIALSRSRKFNY